MCGYKPRWAVGSLNTGRTGDNVMIKTALFWISLVLVLSPFNPARAQEPPPQPFIGEIRWFGYTRCPLGWTEADGQIMQINDNPYLFNALGTNFGGDGRVTFGLPDLRGRVSVHTGQGPGLTSRRVGDTGGSESETLTASQAPAHNHEINISSGDATYSDGINGVLGTASGNKRKNQLYIYTMALIQQTKRCQLRA